MRFSTINLSHRRQVGLTTILAGLLSFSTQAHAQVHSLISEGVMKRLGSKPHEREVPSDFAWRQRAYPFGTIPQNAYERAVFQRDRMAPAHISGERNAHIVGTPSLWKSLGPYNWNPLINGENQYSGTGAVSGRVNAVAYDPKTPSTIYVGAPSGGVFRSTDSGKNWTPLTDTWKFLYISSIAIDPNDPKKIYVGTGDFQGGQGYSFHGQTLGHSFGMMISNDGGVTWNNTGVGVFDSYPVSRILIDPDNTNIITITTGDPKAYEAGVPMSGNIWHSVDSGLTWTKITGTFTYKGKSYDLAARWCNIVCTAKNATGKRRYYAVAAKPNVSGDPIVFLASDDRGATWSQVNGIWKSANFSADLAVSPTSYDTVYLLSTGDRTVYKSTDSGTTWTNIKLNLDTLTQLGSDDLWDQSDYDFFFACSTRTLNGAAQDVVYLGLKEIYQLPDGKAWNSFGRIWYPDAKLHTDQHCITLHPTDPNQGLIGNDGGIYSFAYNPDKKSTTFTSLNANLPITQFYGGDFHPLNAAVMVAGAQDNSTAVTQSSGSAWASIIGGDGGHTAIDPNNPNNQYGTTPQFEGLSTTQDAWKTNGADLFASLNQKSAGSPAWMVPVVLNPLNTQLLYTGGNVLCTYNMATKKWGYSPNNGSTLTKGSIMCIGVAPSDGATIYTGADDGQIWRTPDSGAHWSKISNSGLPNRVINGIVVNPTNPNSILVALSGFGQNGARLDHIWACNDTSASTPVWTSLSTQASGLPDIPVTTIALDPLQPNTTFYAGTDIGVFQTKDGGKSWQNATNPLGLPNVQIAELHAVPGQGYLYAVTYGRGIWRINLTNGEPLYSLTLLPFRMTGGSTTTATILLGAPAPTGGLTINLTSSSSLTTIPKSVVAPAGATSVTFRVKTVKVSATTVVTLTATNATGVSTPRQARLILDK